MGGFFRGNDISFALDNVRVVSVSEKENSFNLHSYPSLFLITPRTSFNGTRLLPSNLSSSTDFPEQDYNEQLARYQ